MSPRTGISQATGGGIGNWRGLSLHNLVGSAGTYSGADALEYDTVLAETDSILSVDPFTFSSITVPAGSAGVVPTGMAGLWRLSLNQRVSNVSAEAVEVDIVINDFDPFFAASFGDGTATLTTYGSFNLTLAPIVLELAEGDVMWTDVLPTGGSVDVGSRATFLMEYLGSA